MTTIADTIRNLRFDEVDLTDLRASMMNHGWVKEFPAIVDEHGVTLVGNRRTKIAKELGIEPVIVKLTLGVGDAADAERLKLALVSNIGGAPMTRRDRKKFARHLYSERRWTMESIAKALGASQQTISRDLRDLLTVSKLIHLKTNDNPKGAGRPKGSRSKQLRESVRVYVEADKPVPRPKLSEEFLVAEGTVNLATQFEKGRVEGLREAIIQAPIDTSILSETQKQKFERLERALRAKLQKELTEARRMLRIEIEAKFRQQFEAWKEMAFPALQKQKNEAFEDLQRAKRLVNGYKPLFTFEQFKILLIVLHPDNSASPETRAEALQLFNDKKLWLTGKK
jgi:ParB-like chromosome segregation protein Spo0J